MTIDPWEETLSGRTRENGIYAQQKLTFFDRYLPPAFRATQRKRTRHYIDLFAGPGAWHDPTGRRHEGSPLRALRLSAEAETGTGFTEAFFVNQDPDDHAALKARVDLAFDRDLVDLPRDRVHCVLGDSNIAIHDILRAIHTKSWVFVYADIENPSQWPWSTVEALRSRGHGSLDLYLLFPLHMALRRIAGYTVRHDHSLTRFFGCEDWQAIVDRRKTSAHSQQFLRELEELYAARLRKAGWAYTRRQRRVAAQGMRFLYYMLFATGHPAGGALSDWEAVEGGDERHRDQFGLFD